MWEKLVSETIKLPLLEQHDMARQGIPITQLNKALRSFVQLTEDEVLVAIGMNKRTVQRRSNGALKPAPSGALLDLVFVVQKATDVLGDRDAAEKWLRQPAVAFNGLRPVDLLSTRQGAVLIKNHLIRMDYGVYV
jgi:putative toxin-antitoxin system antitoxin component (TIGR02293 family)